MASRRPDVFLYQASAQPIVLGELPVTPVLPFEDYAELEGVELIEGGSGFNHFVPEVVIAPCWIQDWSIHPLERELIGNDPFLMHLVPPPVIYQDTLFQVDGPIERPPLIEGSQFDPSAAAQIVVSVFKLDFLQGPDVAPLDYELLSDIGYSPLRDVVILPLQAIVGSELIPRMHELLGTEAQSPLLVLPPILHDWLFNGDVPPRDVPLLGSDAQAPVMFVPQPVLDWLVQQAELPPERWETFETTIPICPVVIPEIQGFYEGLSRAAVQELRPLIGENFHVQITIAPVGTIAVKICRVTAEPAIGVSSIESTPAIVVDEVESAPAIRIDSVDGGSVC